nr:DNA translocase FtsK [Fretibacterium sp.]
PEPRPEPRPAEEAAPILHEQEESPAPSQNPEAGNPQRSAVQILDDLLSSIEAGDFSLPEHLKRPLDEDVRIPAQEKTPAPDAGPCPVPPEEQPVAETAGHDDEIPAPEEKKPEEVLEPEVRLPGAGAFPPPLDLFGPQARDEGDSEALSVAKGQGEVIIGTLKNFGVEASVAHIVVGPSVIQFQIELAPGIKVNRVSGLTNELTMALAVVSVRVEAPIPGLPYVGIEIPNSRRRGIPLRAALEDDTFQKAKALLPLPMGMQVDSRFLVCGLEDMPHLLVAGTTGSGKSVFVNACILGMCSRRTPSELKLILIDPKQVEFAIYEGLPHLMARPVSDPRKAIDALAWAVQEMESRMASFARAQVRTLASFNEKVLPKDRLPSVVVVVDELADLMYTAGKEVEGLLVRLAQKARAAGIHLILATQRPSVDVITGLLKNNVPARVAFAVPSQTDSRTILDGGGADKLLGRGDMLFLSTRYRRPLRLQSPFITEERTLDFVNYMKNVFGEPEYVEFADSSNNSSEGGTRGGGNGAVDDPKMEEAIHAVMEMGITSASGLQRILSIGYPKAGRLITAMEQIGILGPQTPNSTKPRDILMDEESAFEALECARTGKLFDEE